MGGVRETPLRRAAALIVALALAGCSGSDSAPKARPAEKKPRAASREAEPLRPSELAFAGLPAPNADDGFVLDADVDHGTNLKGRLRMAAEPGTFEGEPAWLVVTDRDTPPLPGLASPATTEHETMWLSRTLRILRRDVVTRSEGRTETTSATADGTKVTKSGVGEKTESYTATRGVDDRLTLAAALLYFRMCSAEVTPGDVTQAMLVVTSVEPRELGMQCCARGVDGGADAFIHLVGPGREPALIEEYVGDHRWSTILARAHGAK